MISIFLSLILAAFSAEDSKLIKAVHQGTTHEVKRLAKNRNEISRKDSAGQDALFYAVSLNDVDKVKILINAGASTGNVYGTKNESLLFEATRLGSVEVIELLCKKNPRLLEMKNIDNETPLFTAVREFQSKAAAYLIKRGLSISDKNKSGKTAKDLVSPQNKEMLDLFKNQN